MPDTEAERRAKRSWEAREREKDPEKFKQRQLEAQKRYYEKNAEKIRAHRRQRHAENREAENARARADYVANSSARRAASKAWKDRNPDKVVAYRLDGNLRRYGLTFAQKQDMLTSQGNQCACCGSPDPRGKNGWHVDHCHATGRVRGLLCLYCNVALGKVEDSVERLEALIKYLEKHSA
jgi:Recombination endonuclease VII